MIVSTTCNEIFLTRCKGRNRLPIFYSTTRHITMMRWINCDLYSTFGFVSKTRTSFSQLAIGNHKYNLKQQHVIHIYSIAYKFICPYHIQSILPLAVNLISRNQEAFIKLTKRYQKNVNYRLELVNQLIDQLKEQSSHGVSEDLTFSSVSVSLNI